MNRKHLIVSELEWCIRSQPLMLGQGGRHDYQVLDKQWCHEQWQLHYEWLSDLDTDPSELQALCDAQKLLGKRFETLLLYWFKNSPHFRVLLANHQLSDPQKGTIGEIDWVLEDLRTGEVMHFEAACKFYLGHQNEKSWSNWKGPNGKDTLELKMKKFDAQLSIFSTPSGQQLRDQLRIKSPQPVLFLKGFFFHHFKHLTNHKSPRNSHLDYPSGFWLWQKEMKDFFTGDGLWKLLPKRSWLCEFHSFEKPEFFDNTQIQEIVAATIKDYDRGIMIIKVVETDHGFSEVLRGFVVPNRWPVG